MYVQMVGFAFVTKEINELESRIESNSTHTVPCIIFQSTLQNLFKTSSHQSSMTTHIQSHGHGVDYEHHKRVTHPTEGKATASDLEASRAKVKETEHTHAHTHKHSHSLGKQKKAITRMLEEERAAEQAAHEYNNSMKKSKPGLGKKE